jgi:hypothetical protein
MGSLISEREIKEIKKLYEDRNIGNFDIGDILGVFWVVNKREHSTIEECLEKMGNTNISLDPGVKLHLPFNDSSRYLLKQLLSYIERGDVFGFKIFYDVPPDYLKAVTIYLTFYTFPFLYQKDPRFELDLDSTYEVNINRVRTKGGLLGRVSFSIRERPTNWEKIEYILRNAFEEPDKYRVSLLSRGAIDRIEDGYRFKPYSQIVHLGITPFSVEKIIDKIARFGCAEVADLLRSKISTILEDLGYGREVLQRTAIYFPALIEEKRGDSIVALTPLGEYNFSLENFSRSPQNLYKLRFY